MAGGQPWRCLLGKPPPPAPLRKFLHPTRAESSCPNRVWLIEKLPEKLSLAGPTWLKNFQTYRGDERALRSYLLLLSCTAVVVCTIHSSIHRYAIHRTTRVETLWRPCCKPATNAEAPRARRASLQACSASTGRRAEDGQHDPRRARAHKRIAFARPPHAERMDKARISRLLPWLRRGGSWDNSGQWSLRHWHRGVPAKVPRSAELRWNRGSHQTARGAVLVTRRHRSGRLC